MPRLLHKESLASAINLAAFLGLKEDKSPEADPGLIEKGAKLYDNLRCSSCHVLGTKKDPASTQISLAHVGQKFRNAALASFLLNPSKDFQSIAMPQFGLSPGQAASLAAFLRKETAIPTLSSPMAGDPLRGKALFSRLGCVNCHQVSETLPPTPNAPPFLDLPLSKPCPKTGIAKNPLPRLPMGLPLDEHGRALQASLRCASCHESSVSPSLPNLDSVGEKLRPTALTNLFLGKSPKARPWLKARMPAFIPFSPALVQGLAAEVGLSSKDVAKIKIPQVSLSLGKKLISNEGGFSCVLCHGVGNKKALQVFEVEGINFSLVANRLRKPFYDRWMWNPQRIDPSSKMPRFGTSEGTTAFTEILDGDAKSQFDAVWEYLLSLKNP
jgi:cytochrome c551/c552